MLLRVRSNVGVWRVEVPSSSVTMNDILQGIAVTRPHVVYEQPLSRDPTGTQPLETAGPISGLSHGSMVYCRVDPTTCADASVVAAATAATTAATADPNAAMDGTAAPPKTHMKRVIGKDGSIQMVPTNEVPAEKERGFRKGMMALRDMKMQWTLADFVALNSQFEFKIQRQETALCQQASLEVNSVADFQSYLQAFQFQRPRYGFLYGTFQKDEETQKSKAIVQAIYEPPQEPDPDTPEGFVLLDDPDEEKVAQIAEWLGWTKVGWIFGRGRKEKDVVLTGAEVILAAEFQLEASEGVAETPFCTVKVCPAKDGTVAVEAFQVSQQCMAMVAEEALQVDPENPGQCLVNETFTAIQEGKASTTVENSFFLCVVPIVQHTSEHFISEFPAANRLDVAQSHDALKRQLQKAGSAGWTFEDRLADFNLLIYISRLLEASDLAKICESLANRDKPLADGYKLILKSMAGLEGSY